MNDDLMARLRRLGLAKGARELRPAAAKQQSRSAPVSIGDASPSLQRVLPGGHLEETAAGYCFVVDHVYPLSYSHGPARLEELLQFKPGTLADFCRDGRLDGLDFRDFVFLDTETTGLAGAGTLAFMVGVAYFDFQPERNGAFVVRQFFLRDHGDEPAMLHELTRLLDDRSGLITFNGRSFDLPLLENRYLMNRLSSRVREMPHIDLLPPARRLWRARLGSCRLSSLEQSLLGLERTQEDVPGWLIPSLYQHYLRTGEVGDLVRVFYHNEIDLISMVTLILQLLRQIGEPAVDTPALDLLSLGRWQADLGLWDDAERTLRLAAAGDLPLSAYHEALFLLAGYYKQHGRRAEAVDLWRQIAATGLDSVNAHVELAKHHEWHEVDLPAAMAWTQEALRLADRLLGPAQARALRPELERRRARLEQKLNGRAGQAHFPADASE